MGSVSYTGPLLTDLYQLTMAQAYFLQGLIHTRSVFCLNFRENPFHGGYSVVAGTGCIAEIIENFYFSEEDLTYLASLDAPAGGKLFYASFLQYLRDFKPACTIKAMPEGSLVFPREPLVQVSGSLIECQLLETVLLNTINFQSLVATKTSRVVAAAQGGLIAEFGLRRAQGMDGGIAASRAAYLGGANSSSNVEACKRYGIPVSGTHAHSWVMAFPDELSAFRALAQSMPKNCILLIDTYDVTQGAQHAITVAKEMEAQGERLLAVRIDSGDLALLSKRVRQAFDDAGCHYVKIAVSNNLDEYTIQSLLAQGAPIDVWGVGTKLSTSYDQPALSGVYKLTAIKDGASDGWRPVIKLSEQIYKLSIPGILEARRYYDENSMMVGDMIYDSSQDHTTQIIVDPLDGDLRLDLSGARFYEELLVTMVDNGRIQACAYPDLSKARLRLTQQLSSLKPESRRFLNPQVYPCGIESCLFRRRSEMIKEIRARKTPSWR